MPSAVSPLTSPQQEELSMGTPGRSGSASIRDSRPSSPLYRPADVAKMLHCSEWWVKEQARKRRIPFSLIGGSYRFTDEHVAEVIRLFEQRPESNNTVPASTARVAPLRTLSSSLSEADVLRARVPRRVVKSTQIAS